MRFTALILAGAVAVANAQTSVSAPSSEFAPSSEAATPTAAATAPMTTAEKCLNACADGDVTCKSHCITVCSLSTPATMTPG